MNAKQIRPISPATSFAIAHVAAVIASLRSSTPQLREEKRPRREWLVHVGRAADVVFRDASVSEAPIPDVRDVREPLTAGVSQPDFPIRSH